MSSEAQRLEFRTTGGECAGFLITRVIFTLLTCGIYGFWLASDWKRWLASKTFVNGQPLIYKTSFADFVLSQIVKGAMMLGTCGIYLPWALVKGNRYDWRHTTVADGRTCRFDGSGAEYVVTVIIAALIGLCTCGLGSPWAFAMGVRWSWSRTLIGGERVSFDGKVGDLLVRAIGGHLLCIFTLGIFLPWHIVNLQRWRIENASVALGEDSTPTPPDPIERIIEERAKDPKTWIGLGVVIALLVVGFALVSAVQGLADWVSGWGDGRSHQEVPLDDGHPEMQVDADSRARAGGPGTSSRSPSDASHIDYPMALVPAGEFWMGSAASEQGRDADELRHRVELTRPFYLGEHEVHQQLWMEVMGTNPSTFPGARRPVEGISWYDAVRFANALSEQAGFEPAYAIHGTDVTWNQRADGYRLPTEAEWEYAARGGLEGQRFAGSPQIDGVGWYDGNAGGQSHQIAAKSANPYGLHDMTGNVWEWIWDWYGPYPSARVVDPENAMAKPERCMRGGDWKDTEAHNRVANRGYIKPDNLRFAAGRVGLRLARYAD
jgi:sulfatase modifying factor 1